MRLIFSILTLLVIPLILGAILLIIVMPLLTQHLFKSNPSKEAFVYPYLTSWEEAA